MIDLDRFVHTVACVTNEGGGRGHDTGLRTFDCPLCSDTRGRGWIGVTGFGAGCFNPGCPAEPSLPGGAIEWARRVLRLNTRGEAWRHLEDNFSAVAIALSPGARRWPDFCRMPPEARRFDYRFDYLSPLQSEFTRFVEKQWGVTPAVSTSSSLRWCVSGRHAYRVVIPIVMFSQIVGFQTRGIRSDSFPKYMTSRHGPESDPAAECGRPAAAMLYNVDAVRSGVDVVLVEGAGDVLGWLARGSTTPAVAILGVALTPAKLSLLHAARPSRVVVALDAEPDAQRRALAHVEDLKTWGLDATVGRWTGGKDAGSGAALVVAVDGSLGAAVRARLSRQETDTAPQ